MAVELKRHIEIALTQLPENDTSRRYLEEELAHATAEIRRQKVASEMRRVFGHLPDSSLFSDLIPPHVYFPMNGGKIRRGEFEGMTREELYNRYPVWNSIYSRADGPEKNLLSDLTRLTFQHVGIETLGDLRHADPDTLKELEKWGAKSTRLAIDGFASTQLDAE